jgi:capsular exopolysaccharide synthesis family protein
MSRMYEFLKKAERERQKEAEEQSSLRLIDFPPEGTDEPGDGKAYGSSGLFSSLKKQGPGEPDPFLAALVEPESVVAEQFRKLKTRIHRWSASRPLKTIMITSSTNGEGKSFSVANLAVSLAREIHNRVLMIDCDLRNPTLTKYFGLENGRGLSEYLQGRGELRELVMETGIETLQILPAGMAENAPADLVASTKMKALLNELKSQTETEFVIIDATPVLATTEPEVLARSLTGSSSWSGPGSPRGKRWRRPWRPWTTKNYWAPF